MRSGIVVLGLFVPNIFSMFGKVLVHGRRYYGLNERHFTTSQWSSKRLLVGKRC